MSMAMPLKDTLAQLKSLGNEKVRAQNKKNGAGDNQFGVRHGDIRKLAAKIKTNDHLGHCSLGHREHRCPALLGLELLMDHGWFKYGPVSEPWAVRRFYVRDPFGKLINILQHE